jgi:hypothetical protein
MTRSEALLKLLAHGGLSYVGIVEETGWPAMQVHEAVAHCKADQSIILRQRVRQGLAPIYEINPDKPVTKVTTPTGSLHAIQAIVHPILHAKVPAVGEIKAVPCKSCGLDSVAARRGFEAGTCRHKTACDSAVNPTKALEAAWYSI